MNTDNSQFEVLSSVPEFFGTRLDVVAEALTALKGAAERMGLSLDETEQTPIYNNYVNPAPKTEALNATVVYQNINTTPEAVLRQNIEEAHEKQSEIVATAQDADRLATVSSLAAHRLRVSQAHDGQQPKEQNDQKAA